jgi:hypothetical protein
MQQQQQWQIHDAWSGLAGDLAADWCARCRAAAHGRDAAERARGRKVDWSRGLEDLAVEPHATEAITASHRAVLPMDTAAGKRDGGLDPMRVDYVRIEERTRPSRLLAYYDRALPGHRRRDIENGACYEGLVATDAPDVLQSVDVRITRASDVRRLPEEEQDLVVEILAVKIRNPGLVLGDN